MPLKAELRVTSSMAGPGPALPFAMCRHLWQMYELSSFFIGYYVIGLLENKSLENGMNQTVQHLHQQSLAGCCPVTPHSCPFGMYNI